MKRFLENWTWQRALYLILGGFILVQAIINHQWLGILFGTYFASMGLFNFGCAAGNCSTNSHTSCYPGPMKGTKQDDIQEVEFEEIKK